MNRNRQWAAALGIVLASFLTRSIGAQEQPETPSPTAPQDSAATQEPTKKSFWGDRFALYIEAGGGTGGIDAVDTSTTTPGAGSAVGSVEIESLILGRFAVGWQLPYERGSFRLIFNGVDEEDYLVETTGLKANVANVGTETPTELEWWNVRASDGTLRSVLTPPTWVDTNQDGQIQNEEIVYDTANPAQDLSKPVPDSLENRLQTWDFLYMRDFGGRQWSGQYTAGFRYLIYEGNLPTGAWVSPSSGPPQRGFTDGVVVPLLTVQQETAGLGPTGSLEVQYHLWRRKIKLFGQARFAFVVQSLEASASFVTFVNSSGTTLVTPATIDSETDRATWNLGIELGAAWRVADGFSVELAYSSNRYQNVVYLPTELFIPQFAEQIPQGTTALYDTADLETTAFRISLGFQF